MNTAAHHAAKTKEIPAAPAMSMHPRVNYTEQSPELLENPTELLAATRESSIEEPIRDLVAIRAAQMNGCTSASTCMSSRQDARQTRTAPLSSRRVA